MKRRTRRLPVVPITDPAREWIGSASHDAGSDDFRERQRARMVDAQREREATDAKVTTMGKPKTRSVA